jgi:hypothetical protein
MFQILSQEKADTAISYKVKWPHLTAMPQVTLLNEITEGEALVI